MDQQSAAALIMYINRAIAIIPTTGIEWGGVIRALSTIEQVANGRATIKVEPRPTAQAVDPIANSRRRPRAKPTEVPQAETPAS